MQILCLCKRRPQGRDLFTRPFGRFYYLPRTLADSGHDVHLFLLGYKQEPDAMKIENNLHIYSTSILPYGPAHYVVRAHRLARKLKPHWILGFSDTWYGILAQHLANSLHTRSLIDAYDNYESYIPWATPLHRRWRRACQESDAITAAGPQLLSLLVNGQPGKKSAIVPMAADPIFVPTDRLFSRRYLNLPLDIPLVGHFGSLHKSRDLAAFFTIVRRLRLTQPDLRFVVSGRAFSPFPADIKHSIINLGYLPDNFVPFAINAVDVVISLTLPTSFGRYSYPVKIYEAMKCHIPVISTCLASTQWILSSYPQCLVSFGDTEQLVERLSCAITWNRLHYQSVNDWNHSAKILDYLLTS